MVKLENNKKIKVGILGGTFDPAHKGHLEISKQAKKLLNLKNVIWAITKQNPFKDISKSNLKNRIQFAKKLIAKTKKLLNLKNVIWAITKQNPFKDISKSNLKNRIQFAKKLIAKNDFIKIRFYEEKISSNRTIDLINYLKKDKKYELYFIMGADNLINFHKWHKWKSIVKKCNLLVFDRQGYKAKSLKSVTYNGVNKKRLSFIKFKKVNISSSQLRKV